MKIAIHHIQGSFSDGWIVACKNLAIEVCFVNVYAEDAIQKIKQCDAFMWDWRYELGKNWLFAKQFIYALKAVGIKVFPDAMTCWHYDDKVGQKYLFESLDIPAVPAWIFYDKKSALSWAKLTSYPKVFKLRGGAGSVNVRLAKDFVQAKQFINRMFGGGYPPATGFADFSTKFRKHKRKGDLWRTLIHTLPRVIGRLFKRNNIPNERGYVYFQEFIPNNEFDIRVVVIGDRATGIRRYCRPNDFRASGSGGKSFAHTDVPKECVRTAFDIVRKLKMQSCALDFIRNSNGGYVLVEVSYAFATSTYPGYWDSMLQWHEGEVDVTTWMVEQIFQ